MPETTSSHLRIADLQEDDRPREKAMRYGIRSLSKAELLAIIFGNGTRGKSVIQMSQELLAHNNGRLSDIARLSIKEIIRGNPGIGPAKAISLAAAIELGIRCRDESPLERPTIVGSASAFEIMRGTLQRINHEEFWIMMLSRSNQVLNTFCLSSGGTAGTVVDTKILFKRVLTEGDRVSSIILFHNHPSGNLRSSAEDDRLTSRIVEAGKLLDINVLDHIIITPTGYMSYRDEGKL